MKAKVLVTLFLCLFFLFSQGEADAVIGIPDATRAATLVVPLMESSISGSQNTLITVKDLCAGSHIIHWEIWDIDGNRVGLYGNATFDGTWVSDFKNIVATATAGQKTQLTDGSYYRGFMTIDHVTSNTDLPPTNVSYPFSNSNCLTGRAYYVKLSEGAANGIPMVHIEAQSGLPSTLLHGFYQETDDREEIDTDARYYTQLTSKGLAGASDPNDSLDYIYSRVYLSPPNGASRIVIWAWGPQAHGTNVSPGAVKGGPFTYKHYNELNALVSDTTVNLDHIVNIIDVPGTENGDVMVGYLPEGFQVYAYSFNTSFDVVDPSLTWEVMFESTIIAEW